MAGTSTLSLIIRALDEFSGELNKLSGMVQGVATQVTSVNSQASKAALSLTNMAQTATAFQQLGIRLAAVGAALTASVVVPIKAAAEFERAIDRVVAVTEGAQTSFKALERTASELGRTTRYTATEAAEGMRFLGMAGFDAAETMSAIGPALKLAAAGSMDLSSAADIATNIMTAMRVPVEELEHVVDVLAKTSTSSNTSVVQMAEALKYTAPLAQSAGVTLEQVSAAIGVLGNNGIQASLAGTSLRGMLLSLSAPTKRARDTLAEMGVVIARNQDGTIDLVETLKRLRDANITLAESNALFLRRSAAGAVALSQQVDEVEKLTKANMNSVRAGTEMYNLMEGNLIGAVILLSSAFNGLMRAVGEPLLKPIEAFIRGFATVVSAVAEAITSIPILTKLIVTFVGVVGGLAVAIGALSIAMGAWVQIQRAAIVVEITKHWHMYTTAIKEATVATLAFFASTNKAAALTAAFELLISTIQALGAAMKAALSGNAIGLAISLIAAAIVGLITVIAIFYKSTEQLIDAQKKLGAELDDRKKSLKDLDRAMEANKNNTEDLSETTLKLRTHMIETAGSSKTLSVHALAVANSIDILKGEFTDGGKALEAYRTELEKQKFETITKQIYLYSEALKSAQGDTFWSALARDMEIGIAKGKEFWMTISTFGGLLGKVTDYSKEVVKAHENEMRISREQTKLAANELLGTLKEMGQIDFNWTEGELRALLKELGITYEDAIQIYIAQFNKFRDAHKDANKTMVANSAFRDDETVRHFAEAVDKQIEQLNRLKDAQLEAVSKGNADVVGSLTVEIEAAQASLSYAMDKHQTSITDRRLSDAKASMETLRRLKDEYEAFRKEVDKISAANPKDSRLGGLGKDSSEKNKVIEEAERKLNQNLELMRQENMNRVVQMEEERTADIEHNEKLKAISTEEAERQRLASAIETSEGRLRVIQEENALVAAGLRQGDALVRASAAAQIEAIDAVRDARKAAADYELELVFKHAGELQRAADKAESSKLQAAPDSVEKFKAQTDAELKELERTHGEKLAAGKKYEEDRQAQLAASHKLLEEYLKGEQTEEKKQVAKTLKDRIAELETSSKQYLSSVEKFEGLKKDVVAKFTLEEQEYIKKQSVKKQKEILERMRAELEEKKQLLDEELSLSEYNYQKGNISLEQHYENRKRIIAEKIDGEIALLQAKIAAAQTNEEKLTLTAQINVKRVEETVRLSKEERTKSDDIEANERAVQNSLIDIRRKALTEWEFEERAKIEGEAFQLRQKQELEGFVKRNQEKFTNGTTWEKNLTQFQNDQAKERADFERNQRLDLEKAPLVQEAQEITFQESVIPEYDIEAKLQAERDAEINSYQQRLIEYQKFTDDETAIAKQAQKTKEAIVQAEADHEQAVLQYRLSLASQWSSDMADYFGGLYEASGKRIKEFFYMQKAAAIAQTIIDTYASAQAAFYSQVKLGPAGPFLAGAAAAAAIAQGMARVYAIQSQTLAAGGKVEERPDFEQNVKIGKKVVPIRVTAKEWKFPKERVGQYGPKLFEALREKSIPKAVTNMMLGGHNTSGHSAKVVGYGEVKGFSSHPKADNIESFARPGDFVLPVDSARVYGRDFMQALSQGKIPTNWMEMFSPRKDRGYSSGGEVESDTNRAKRSVPTKWIDLLYEQNSLIQKTIRDNQRKLKKSFELEPYIEKPINVNRYFTKGAEVDPEPKVSSSIVQTKLISMLREKSVEDRISSQKDIYNKIVESFIVRKVQDHETIQDKTYTKIFEIFRQHDFKDTVEAENGVFKSLSTISNQYKLELGEEYQKEVYKKLYDTFRKHEFKDGEETRKSVYNQVLDAFSQRIVEEGKASHKELPTKWIQVLYEHKPTIERAVQTPQYKQKEDSDNTKGYLTRKTDRGSRQRYSDGGEVSGSSPHTAADNIPIWATAEEWVMPVRAVRRYGKHVMAAIQKGLVPAEVFKTLKLPTINIPNPPTRYAYATGGQVSSGGSSAGGRGASTGDSAASPINIVNVVDSSLMDQYMSSNSGQKMVLNILSANQPAAQRAIMGRT